MRRGLLTNICTIETLGNAWVDYPGFLKEGTGKEQCDLEGLEAWTHEGWKPIRQVKNDQIDQPINKVTIAKPISTR